jgi:hypothetical protein
MYLNKAIGSLSYGAALCMTSIGVMAWVPRLAVLIMFSGGVLLLAYGWVITLFMAFSAIMDLDSASPEHL